MTGCSSCVNKGCIPHSALIIRGPHNRALHCVAHELETGGGAHTAASTRDIEKCLSG
jgi:hypothetical protein